MNKICISTIFKRFFSQYFHFFIISLFIIPILYLILIYKKNTAASTLAGESIFGSNIIDITLMITSSAVSIGLHFSLSYSY